MHINLNIYIYDIYIYIFIYLDVYLYWVQTENGVLNRGGGRNQQLPGPQAYVT